MGQVNDVTFTLNAYEFHELLHELELCASVINRDVSVPRRLLKKLATQCGITLIFNESEKGEV